MTLRGFAIWALLSTAGLACAGTTSAPPDAAFPVGFRVDRLTDPARPFADPPGSEPGPRPIQAYLWYPAASACAAPISWGDVVAWLGVEASHATLDPARAGTGRGDFVAWISSLGADSTAARAALGLRLRACADAPPSAARHPLALLAVGRDDSPVLHVLLGEELAARGWVVASGPGLGARERAMAFEPADVDAQVADLATLRRHAASFPFVDASEPAVIGFSFGGGSAILYAMADTTAAAVVSLDGSIGFRDRTPVYVGMAGWRPDRIRARVLHLRAPDEQRNDPTALESLASEVVVETIDGATHYDFTILGPVTAGGVAIESLGMDDADGDEIYARILTRVVRFLGDR